MTPGPGIEPGTQWWKASALATAPSLLHPPSPSAPPWGQYFRFRIHVQPLKSIVYAQRRCFGNYRTFQFQGSYLFSGLLPTRSSPPHCGENCIGHPQDNVFERYSEYIGERHHTHSLAVVAFHHFAFPTLQLPLRHYDPQPLRKRRQARIKQNIAVESLLYGFFLSFLRFELKCYIISVYRLLPLL